MMMNQKLLSAIAAVLVGVLVLAVLVNFI